MGNFDSDLNEELSKRREDRGQAVFLIDMDGVLADLEGYVRTVWEQRHPNLPLVDPEKRTTFYIDEDHPSHYSPLLEEIICEREFFSRLPLIEGAHEGIHTLARHHEVFICTSPLTSNPTCTGDKLIWVEKNLGREWVARMIIAKDKTAVRGDVLLDDRPEVLGNLKPSWEHLVFGQPYNRHCVNRVDNWSHVLEHIEKKW